MSLNLKIPWYSEKNKTPKHKTYFVDFQYRKPPL